MDRRALGLLDLTNRVGDRADVLGRRTAAATDEAESELGDETTEASANSSAVSGYSAPLGGPSCGRPALGMTDTGSVEYLDR